MTAGNICFCCRQHPRENILPCHNMNYFAAEGSMEWLLAWQQCRHDVGQHGVGTDMKGGWGHLSDVCH